ncbi:hypothetical protein TSUD_279460 [Trifolium subterraneum]|uniref:Uncharacterized protein n=1 Tax=Trifolium subterraneum TaxID=3900 RepID=A0A2Z6N8Y1_TRISU|nr:hypothetical protein TSUD_279460 [Trifolium subterraneum]
MASGSNANNDGTNNNNVDVVPPFTLNTDDPVLMPVDNTDQPIPETDHRDGRETSLDYDDDDAVQFLSEQKKGKQSQAAPEKSVANPQPNSLRVSETAALVDALRETIRTVNEKNTCIRALEDGQRQILGYFKPSSPPRRAEHSESPPARRAGTSQRRPVLERVQRPPQVQKRNRTHPREDSTVRATKRGKTVAHPEQRSRSPPQRKQLLLEGMTHGSRGDDYKYRRENSPCREETPTHSLGWSDDEVYRGPLSKQIMDLELPRALQKPPQLGKYDGLTDLDIHIQNIDVIINYQAVKGGIKCRIFPTTLVEGAMTWYRSLPQGSITSWKDLCKQFTSHSTASRKHAKTEANLEALVQEPNETLRSYIGRFNKEAVQVDVTNDMKKIPDAEEPPRWNQYEEETMVDAIRYSRTKNSRPPREQSNKNGDKHNRDKRGRYRSREPKGCGDQISKIYPFKLDQDRSRFCAYHKSYGHLTEDCIQFKDAIEILIRNGKLKDYVKRKENPRHEKREGSPEDKPSASAEKNVALAVWRPEDFYVPNYLKDTYEHPILNEWEKFPETMVIPGGVFDKHTIDSVKRKFEDLISASLGMAVTLGKPKTSSQPISFYLEELPEGSANSQIPLLVRADMENFDVRRILVDSGSLCDIMYVHLFRTLQLDESHLTPYLGSDLQEYNEATTKPWGYVDLIVTFGHNETAKSIKVKFLVVDCPSLYQCIIGRTTIADLPAVASTAHLKMKYYTDKGTKPPPQQPPQNVSLVDLDSRHSKQEHKEEKKLRKEKKESDAASKENLRPIPDGDFELIPLGDDPSRNLKIGKEVPDLARKQLVGCLKDNADLFAWSASEMSGFDPDIACHQLTVDEGVSVVVQCRRRQSLEKMEAAEKAVKDLLEANFIYEAKYTTWLSNLVLAKKSNGKWRMCVDYTDLNRAYPKDPYPLPCIDRLVDNSSGFKLLSFLDAYSGYNQIPMAVADRTKMAFMTESGNYYYNVMPFGLKNAGATYQRMMNKVFRGEIRDMLEVYMDDMIVKSYEEVDHTIHLQKVFEQAIKVNMRFNPEKCTFGIRAGKFLDFYLSSVESRLTPINVEHLRSSSTRTPLFKLLRKESAFEWTEECEQALQHLKKALFEPPVLSRRDDGEVLYLYLVVASEVVSTILIRETLEGQKPVYFTSKALQGPELRYQRIEKVAIALVNAARRLRYYFLAHTIMVRTNQPIKSLIVRPDMAGRMLKWSLELSEFDIRYESRKALKAQILPDFMAEMTCSQPDRRSEQAEYEAFLPGLRLAEDVGAKEIKIYTDSQLVASQVLGEYQAKNDNLSEYLALVKERITKFDSAEIQHVPREHNKWADILSKLASTKRKNGNKSVIQEILSQPSIQKPARVPDINAIGDTNCWMTPLYNYLAHGTLPNDEKEATTCVDEATADYILHEIHEGINSQHLGGRSLARKALRGEYCCPTMQQDAKEHWGMDILVPFTRGNLQCRFLIVGVDYFTKWVEAEPLPEITSFRILRFFKRDILCHFRIPQDVVTDNGKQKPRTESSCAGWEEGWAMQRNNGSMSCPTSYGHIELPLIPLSARHPFV